MQLGDSDEDIEECWIAEFWAPRCLEEQLSLDGRARGQKAEWHRELIRGVWPGETDSPQ